MEILGGNPILLMADRQTAGGYPIIGHIISVDLPKVAQGKTGDRVFFSKATVEESQTLLREQERMIRLLKLGTGS